MYIIVKENQIIAAHDNKEVALKYLEDQNESSKMKILKIKKKKRKELEDIPDLLDVYLVRYGDLYIPYDQYIALKDLNGQRDFDLKYCRDVLFRLLEENVVSKKDISAVKKVLSIVISEIESLDDNDYETLEKIKTHLNELKN